MLDKTRYYNPSHVGVNYVRDQPLMLSHTHVNLRPYESVHHLLSTLVVSRASEATIQLSSAGTSSVFRGILSYIIKININCLHFIISYD
jgi:hypothetical protein